MNTVDLNRLDPETSFKVKMEVYLYIDAGVMIDYKKGDKLKLKDYMERRLKIIENMAKVKRPFKIKEGKDTLLEVVK